MSSRRSLGGVLAVGAAGGAALLAVRVSGGELGLPACPLHAATGLWCPFCGGVRAAAALSRGDLAAALGHNVVAVAILVAAVAFWVRQLAVALGGGRPGFPALPPRVLAATGVVLLVFMVWRNVPALPFADYLAP